MHSLTWRDRGFILVLSLCAFWPALRMPLILDDHDILEHNSTTTSWSWAHVKKDFTSNIFNDPHNVNYYRPLTTLSERFDYTFWGTHRLLGFHVTNLLFHVAAALLLATLTLTLGFSYPAAFMSASLFAVLPAGVDLQMLVSARAEQMALGGSLLCVICFLRQGWKAATVGTLAFVLALLSKESAVITPAILAIAFLAQKRSWRHYVGLWPLAAVTAIYILWRDHAVGALFDPRFQAGAIDAAGIARFFIKAYPRILLHYVHLVLVPWGLYYPRLIPPASPHWLFYLVGLMALTAGIRRLAPRWGTFCLAWFVLQLLPKTVMMIRTGGMLDHWVYPAAFALLLPLSSGLAVAGASPRIGWRRAARAAFWVWIAAGVLLCRLNVAVRGTDEKAYRWTLRHDPAMNVIRFKLAATLLQQGRADEALDYFSAAYAAQPADLEYGNGLVIGLWRAGRPWQALALAETLERSNPGDALTRTNLAEIRKRLPSRAVWRGVRDLNP